MVLASWSQSASPPLRQSALHSNRRQSKTEHDFEDTLQDVFSLHHLAPQPHAA